MAPQSYAQRVIADGATGYWRLDETSGLVVRDSIGGNHGTVIGGTTLGQPGALVDGNKAVAFDGVTGKISIPKGPYTDFGTGPFSWECWKKAGSLNDPLAWFFDCGQASTFNAGFSFFADAGSRYAKVSWGGGVNQAQVGVTPGPSVAWEHLVGVFVRGPDILRFYINGAFMIELLAPTQGASVNAISPLTFGTYPANVGPTDMFRGLMDECAIYPYALSPAQIAAHYQLGVGQFADAPARGTSALPLVDKVLLAGQAVLGAGAGVDVAGCASLAFTVVGNGPVTAGAVQLEEAHDANYAGAWAALGAPVTVPAGAATVKLNQTAKAVRARVSTAIVGGSASVSLVAR